MKTFLVSLFALGVLLVGSAPSGVGASVGFTPAGLVPRVANPTSLRTPTAPHTAGSFGCGPIACTDYQAGVNGFLQDVATDSGTSNNIYSAATQYSDTTGNIAYSETFGGTYVDTKGFPANGCPPLARSTCLSESQLVTEINSVLSSQGWTANETNLFFILLPAGVDTCFDNSSAACFSNVFCAYHDSSNSLIFAVQPFAAEQFPEGDCSRPDEGFPNGSEIDQTVNTISHEHNEAVTDPFPGTGWFTNDGSENGDLCFETFGTATGTTIGGQPYNQVINGHNYSLQEEYSNADSGCVQYLGGPTSPISNGGSGPLTYHDGPVMRSATVYTIYWIPSAPVSSVAPTVSGTAVVGKKLKTTNGTWANSPTSYLRKWQRCDDTGANCVDIKKATSLTYTLVSADAGHEIRSAVKASNSVGPAVAGYTPSLPTAVVVKKPTVISKPVLSGTAQVGMQLSVTTGSWTYSPTSYAYRWLRCTAAGRSCINIGGATASSYTLTKADIGHRLRVRVTAKNAAGPSTPVIVGPSDVTTG